MQGKAQDLFKAFTAEVSKVTNELKAKNPELFSGDAKKLQVSRIVHNLLILNIDLGQIYAQN